jgi:amidase
MTPHEYLRHDASALAARVAQGEVSAAELLDLALARAEALNPKTNAICAWLAEPARQQLAGTLQGPLAGVPFLIKDAVQHYAGWPTACGSRALAQQPATQHSFIVRRLLGAGAVIFGKTNTPELALKAVTDPRHFGRSSNPWNLAHTTGGSSGGSAAAVASGVVPMAAANDGGGSIRIPAACCGLLGLRPSRGRVSVGPAHGEIWDGASSDGVLSRSVRDTALALDILSGPEPGDPYTIAPPTAAYGELVRRAPGRLRIGFSSVSPIGTPVHGDAEQAVHGAAALLEGLGHHVEEAAPQIDGDALAHSYLHIYLDHVSASVALARSEGAKADDFELLTRVLATLGGAASAMDSTLARLRRNDFARALADFHGRFDLLLTPTLAQAPITHGQGDLPAWQQRTLGLLAGSGLLWALAHLGLLDSTVRQIARDNLRYVPFTQLANLTGVPAMSVPLHWTAAGLPLGVQFVARFGDEATLLQLAAQLEQAQPWFERLAPLARNGLSPRRAGLGPS